MVYLNHRRFLPLDDALRNDRAGFPSKRKPPPMPVMKTQAYIDEANRKYEALSKASEARRRTMAQRTGCKGKNILRKLPNHNRFLNTPVDPMHLIKNIVEHIVCLLAGLEDSHKVRAEKQQRGRFRDAWVRSESAQKLPDAPFRLNHKEVAITAERANSVQVPASFDWKPRPIFGKKGVSGMTSHAWKELVSTRILKFTLRGLLGKKQRLTLFFFLDTLALLLAETVDMSSIDSLEYDVHKALSLLERDFPVSLHVIVFHLLHHLPMFLRRFGPVYSHWMYIYERFNSWIIRRVHNRRYPEATVLETYRLFNFAYILQMSGQLPENAVLHPDVSEYVDSTLTKVQLGVEDMANLKQHYEDSIPQYKELCQCYNTERKKAKAEHRLRCFPEMATWIPAAGSPPLSSLESEMRTLSTEAQQLTHYRKLDNFGRKVVFTCASSDTPITKSSYIYLKLHNSCIFGQIRLIFSHTFCGNSTTLAVVDWFSLPTKDKESNLLFVYIDRDNDNTFHPIVPVTKLCGPVVTAIDHDRLWILSVI